MEGESIQTGDPMQTTEPVEGFVCMTIPAKVNSNGLFTQLYKQRHGRQEVEETWLDFSGPRFELIVFVMFAATLISHFFLKRVGAPRIVSQIVAGLLLSPSISLLPKAIETSIYNDSSIELLGGYISFGYLFFIFLSGVKVDIKMALKSGKKPILIGLISIIIPLLFASLATLTLFTTPKARGTFFYIISLFVITPFPVINTLISDLKIPNSELGRLTLSTSIISDLTGFTLNLIKIFTDISQDNTIKSETFYYELVYVTLFVLFIVLIYRPLMKLVAKYTPEGGQVKSLYVYLTIIPIFFCMKIPYLYSHFNLLLVYALGLSVPAGPPLGATLVDKFEGMVSSFFVPLFVTSCGMRVDYIVLRVFDGEMQKMLGVVFGCLVLKFGCCVLPLLRSGMLRNDVVAFGLIFCCKGIVELAAVSYGSDAKLITQDQFVMALLLITTSSTLIPILIKRLYDPTRKFSGYQNRKISDCQPNSDLKIISCIHVPNNVSSVINLLQISHPTIENPITLTVLHLIKLHARANPIFLSHQKLNKNLMGYNYSENVIVSFKNFETANWGAITIDVFTAMSKMELMDEDICTLALDKQACFVILPFHKTWYIDGTLESDNHAIRLLNYRVLEKAPCSIGILIDHNVVKRSGTSNTTGITGTNHSVTSVTAITEQLLQIPVHQYQYIAVCFIGGFDDREALALGKRMASDGRVRLTVAHFVGSEEEERMSWESILDSEVLKEVKSGGVDGVRYERFEVNDGPETVSILREMVEEYCLVIVGRRYGLDCQQTFGLKEWVEFPELGILGDTLASKDMGGKCSVLVVQQQLSIKG